jgi:hypothetical protein
MSSIPELRAAIQGMKAAMMEVSMSVGATVERGEEVINLNGMILAESNREEAGQLTALLAEFKQTMEAGHDIADRYIELCEQFAASL